MKKQLFVSVIIPSYNAAKFLPHTIESALKQTYKNIEVVVVDDGSTDGTESLPIFKDRRVRYFKISHSGGPATPRNVGIQNAKGDLIAFLDSDDIWLPKKLEKQVNFMEKGRFDFVSSDAGVINEKGKKFRESYLGKVVLPIGNVFPRLYESNFVITSSVIVKRSAFDRSGFFDQSANLVGVEDYDMWLRISASGASFGFLPQPLLLYRNLLSGLRYRVLRLGNEREFRVIAKNFGTAKQLLGALSKSRPFRLSRAIAATNKGKSLGEYLRYKLLSFRYFPWGTGGWRELWSEAKSVIKL